VFDGKSMFLLSKTGGMLARSGCLRIWLLPVLIMSWAFGWTPADLECDADVVSGESVVEELKLVEFELFSD